VVTRDRLVLHRQPLEPIFTPHLRAGTHAAPTASSTESRDERNLYVAERRERACCSQEAVMKVLSLAVTLVALAAGPAFAQTERGYVTGAGGFAVSPDTTSGDVVAEVGVKIAPHLMVFGDVGQFHNLQPSDVQPAIDSTTTTLSGFTGLNVVGTARVPAWYSLGGLRYEAATRTRVTPYVLGGIGFARLMPTATFTYTSGPLPDGSTPTVGADVTSTLLSAGDFAAPPATTAFMFTMGGGVEVPVAQHWAADIGYRFSRVAAATPVDSQGATFGIGYRF